jgi:hypothetical protein
MHFWGDYDHYIESHSWYESEIRIVKNRIGVESYKDAQSFRINGTQKLNVIKTKARIFHYGWVRPPHIMQSKRKEQYSIHFGKKNAAETFQKQVNFYEYGPLGHLTKFKGTHPKVMRALIVQHSWKDKLDYGGKYQMSRPKASHERIKYKVLSFIEKNILGGKKIFGYKNWNILKGKKYRSQ